MFVFESTAKKTKDALDELMQAVFFFNNNDEALYCWNDEDEGYESEFAGFYPGVFSNSAFV